MTEKKESKGKISLNSRFWRTLLIVLAAFLTFACPTYMVYALVNVLKADYFASIFSGFASFIIGLALVLYLIKKDIFA